MERYISIKDITKRNLKEGTTSIGPKNILKSKDLIKEIEETHKRFFGTHISNLKIKSGSAKNVLKFDYKWKDEEKQINDGDGTVVLNFDSSNNVIIEVWIRD